MDAKKKKNQKVAGFMMRAHKVASDFQRLADERQAKKFFVKSSL
jgi:hypothetical protein